MQSQEKGGLYGVKNVTQMHDDHLLDETMDERYQQHIPIACTPALSTSRAGRHLPRPYGERDIGSA